MLAYFAQEPAHCLMDEVFLMVQEYVGDGKTVVVLIVADKGHAADDGYALFPKVFAIACQVVKECAVFVEEPHTKNLVAGEVDEVPIVNIRSMGEVEFDTTLL